jgi:DNA-binding CsgD family transcriptional regulator
VSRHLPHCLDGFVHPSDIDALREVFARLTSDSASISINVRLRAVDGAWWPALLTLGPTAREAIAGRGETDRIAELEQHLTKIAREVEAAGLIDRGSPIPDPASMPTLGDLTSRQWHILTRLLRGERVPTIARAMFLSASTVRNHLSVIYKKLGVHSQAELIEKLRPTE